MRQFNSTIPVYQTLSLWDLVEPGSDAWMQVFPFNAPNSLWTFNGRVALHIGLPQLNLPPGSTILVPNYFQGVEIETFLHNGFELEFYCVDSNLRVDLNDIESRLNPSVSALHVIHYFGWPQQMGPIVDFCRNHSLKLIEDCALSLFSRDSVDWLGTYGDLALFSVYKTLPLPHGGYLVLRERQVSACLKRAPLTTTLAQTTDLLQEYLKSKGWQQVERCLQRTLGALRHAFNSEPSREIKSGGATWEPRLLEYCASRFTRTLMRNFQPDTVISRRRRNYLHLATRLADHGTHPLGELPEYVCPLFYPVMVKDKREIITKLAAQGVGSVNLWWEPHPACPTELASKVAYLREGLLELPVHQSLSLHEIDRLAETFLSVTESD